MEARIGHDPDRDRPRRQRDHPHPVTLAAQVIGRELAQAAFGHPPEELLVVRIGPIFDVQPAVEPEPGRVHDVAVVLQQIELSLKQERPPGGVDDPARPHFTVLTLEGHPDHVRAADLDVLHAAAPKPANPPRARLAPQQVLDPPPADSVARPWGWLFYPLAT